MFEDLIYHASFLLPSIIISRSWTNLTKDFKTNISWLVFVFYIFSVVGGGNSSEILSSTYIGNVLAMILIPNIIMLAYFKITGKEIKEPLENKPSRAEKKNTSSIKKAEDLKKHKKRLASIPDGDLQLKDYFVGIDTSTKVKLIIIFILSVSGVFYLLLPFLESIVYLLSNFPKFLSIPIFAFILGFTVFSIAAVITFLIFKFLFIKEFNKWYNHHFE